MTGVTVAYLHRFTRVLVFAFRVRNPDSDPNSRPIGLHPSLCLSSAILSEPISKVLAGRINAFFLRPFGEKLLESAHLDFKL